MTWLLNLFGERDWCVTSFGGTFWSQPTATPLITVESLVRRDLTRAAAQHLARSLRHKAENTPRDVM